MGEKMKGHKLDIELVSFQEKKEELLKEHQGKFVLIKGEEIVDFFDTAKNAYSEGAERFEKDTPFLVKQILKEEMPQEILSPWKELKLLNRIPPRNRRFQIGFGV